MGKNKMISIDVPIKTGVSKEDIYNINDFPYDKYLSAVTAYKYGKSVINIPCALDIETTNVKCDNPYAFMYLWQICINDTVCMGRTWEELLTFFDRLIDGLQLSKSRKIVIYIHNFSFEFQFMRSFFQFTKIFARAKRKPIKAECYDGAIEFRCSYFLSNMSLQKFCENSRNCIHYKLDGEQFDYKKIRTPETKLENYELAYAYNDVRGLCECIADRLQEDNLFTIPITSTGYVRREYRIAMQKNSNNFYNFIRGRLTERQYILLREAFRGGNTHANAIYSGEIINNVQSFDLASSYPAAMFIDKFPARGFLQENPEKLEEYIRRDYACLIYAKFVNVSQKISYGVPYIDVAHMRNIDGKIYADNGRLLRIEGSFEMALTDIDYKIIKNTYNIETIYCGEVHISEYGYLSDDFRSKLLEYFTNKCKLKGKDEYLYAKEKNKVNASFGMMVTDIAQSTIYINDAGQWEEETPSISDALEKYYSNKKSFLSYQHGVWCTANARKRLQEMLDTIGIDVVYCDTDSIKCINDHRKDFTAKNEDIIEKIKSAPLPPIVEVDGKIYTCGTWEYEGIADKFITLGAKKYATEKNGKITTTVAGLGKKEGSAELAKGKGLKDFKIGKVFIDSGRLTAYYNDELDRHTITVNGEQIVTGANVCLLETTYELGVTDEYYGVIKKAKNI